MPNPKHKHSKTRNRRDRAVWRKRVETAHEIAVCSNPECRQPVRPHHVCLECGTYDGKKVMEIKTKETK
ncbi:MAG: 50S ribosomal protein L32 [Candidatus Wallbacteria bacterium]